MDAPATTKAPPSLAGFDLRALPDDFYADPYPYYDALRRETPIRPMPDGSYLLTRFKDCEAVYKDTTLFSSDKKEEFKPKFGDTLVYEHHTTSLVFNDPPLHTKVRKLMLGALNAKAIAAMEPGLVALVEDLLARMAEKEANGETVDLIADFAAAIPVEIIGNLLDIPHAERGPLRGWSLKILGALEPTISAEQLAETDAAVRDFLGFLEALVADRKKHPGDPQSDVLTRLLGEIDGERLTHTELLQNCIFILNAGHETTTNLIANGLVTLARWPAEKARLIAKPGADALGGGRSAALRKLQPARQPRHHRRHRDRRRRHAQGHAHHAVHRRRQPRPRRSFPSRINSASTARPTAIWPSPADRTSARAWRWRGSRARWRWRCSCSAIRTIS